MKDRTTAGILALLLGAFGVHFFYLGRAGMGIVCLLFFWTGIPFIIGIVNGISYLTMSDGEFSARYNGGRQPVAYGQPATAANVGDELTKLHELKEKGVLTEEEFAARKAKLLA